MLESLSNGAPSRFFFDGDVTGQTLLIQGGAGTVGHHAIQIAKRAGARVIATVSGPKKAKIAEAAGADEVLNYKDGDYVDRLLKLTAGRGADRIIEVSLSANANLYDRILAPKARLLSMVVLNRWQNFTRHEFHRSWCPTEWFIVYELTEVELRAGRRVSQRHACRRRPGHPH